jgi:ribosomal protein S18 acetylase RimI-like enzyme
MYMRLWWVAKFDSIVTKLNYTKLKMDKNKQIQSIAKKYGFFPEEVKEALLIPSISLITDTQDRLLKTHCSLYTKNKNNFNGFSILWYNDHEIQIKFIFIEPGFRGKGFGKEFLNKLKNMGVPKISLATRNNTMVRICHKCGYKLIRKCDNDKDLLFIWEG